MRGSDDSQKIRCANISRMQAVRQEEEHEGEKVQDKRVLREPEEQDNSSGRKVEDRRSSEDYDALSKVREPRGLLVDAADESG